MELLAIGDSASAVDLPADARPGRARNNQLPRHQCGVPHPRSEYGARARRDDRKFGIMRCPSPSSSSSSFYSHLQILPFSCPFSSLSTARCVVMDSYPSFDARDPECLTHADHCGDGCSAGFENPRDSTHRLSFATPIAPELAWPTLDAASWPCQASMLLPMVHTASLSAVSLAAIPSWTRPLPGGGPW